MSYVKIKTKLKTSKVGGINKTKKNMITESSSLDEFMNTLNDLVDRVEDLEEELEEVKERLDDVE